LISAKNEFKKLKMHKKKIVASWGARNEGTPVGCGDCPLLGG
jgi:hypothetical protein